MKQGNILTVEDLADDICNISQT